MTRARTSWFTILWAVVVAVEIVAAVVIARWSPPATAIALIAILGHHVPLLMRSWRLDRS